MKKLLFLCTGNYYRSRFAEIYFNSLAKKQNINWQAFSRGFDISNPDNTGFISPHAIEKLSVLNIPLPEDLLFPALLTPNDLQAAARIIVLNKWEHEKLLKKAFPGWEDLVEFWEIRDLYEECHTSSLSNLQNTLDVLIEELTNVDQSIFQI